MHEIMQFFVNEILKIIQVKYFCPNVIFPILENMEGIQHEKTSSLYYARLIAFL